MLLLDFLIVEREGYFHSATNDKLELRDGCQKLMTDYIVMRGGQEGEKHLCIHPWLWIQVVLLLSIFSSIRIIQTIVRISGMHLELCTRIPSYQVLNFYCCYDDAPINERFIHLIARESSSRWCQFQPPISLDICRHSWTKKPSFFDSFEVRTSREAFLRIQFPNALFTVNVNTNYWRSWNGGSKIWPGPVWKFTTYHGAWEVRWLVTGQQARM